jgi:hypothetical protein
VGKETPRQKEATESTREAKGASRDDPWLRCAACGHPIAREEAAIDVQGTHVHTFVNPAGHAYTIRCFAEAPGCRGEGQESTFWTWFPGFAWRIALCAGCGAHVGWSFRSDTGGFWGLVADRVL